MSDSDEFIAPDEDILIVRSLQPPVQVERSEIDESFWNYTCQICEMNSATHFRTGPSVLCCSLCLKDKDLAVQTEYIIREPRPIDPIVLELPKMSNLIVFTLNYCNVDDNSATRLADAMKNCINITHFDVQYNHILEKGFTALIPRVNVLKIATCFLQPGQGYGNRMSLSNVVKLLELPAPVNPNSFVDRDHCERIGIQIYPKVGVVSLRSCCLSEMNLSDAGAIIVANSFPNLVNLELLYLYDSRIGDEGGNTLARMMPISAHLKSLHLWSNYLSPECNENFDIMNQLRQASGLNSVEVDLRYQHRVNTDAEAQEIARRIPSMANGTVIDFSSEGKKFTSYGKGLIEGGNETRKRFGLQKLEIRF